MSNKLSSELKIEENSSQKQSPTIWFGIGFGGRPCEGTYDCYEYKSLPPVTFKKEFESIKTFSDIEENFDLLEGMNDSPTACYFDLHHKKKIFYRDQQDCILWALNDHNQVYSYPDENDIVADSLPEFLTRIYIESKLWEKLPKDYSAMWGDPPKKITEKDLECLNEDEKAYAQHYIK